MNRVGLVVLGLAFALAGCGHPAERYCQKKLKCEGEAEQTVRECVASYDQAYVDAERAGCMPQRMRVDRCGARKSRFESDGADGPRWALPDDACVNQAAALDRCNNPRDTGADGTYRPPWTDL